MKPEHIHNPVVSPACAGPTIGYRLASRRDAMGFAFSDPVVSLVPRSTTGYKLGSLRDQPGRAVSDHFVDVNKMVRIGLHDAGGYPACSKSFSDMPEMGAGSPDAGGIPACSRWLSAATPPVPNPPESRTPAGVPSCSRWSNPLQRVTPPDPDPEDASDAGGIPACSRWSSEATPPDHNPRESRTPAGVPAPLRPDTYE